MLKKTYFHITYNLIHFCLIFIKINYLQINSKKEEISYYINLTNLKSFYIFY